MTTRIAIIGILLGLAAVPATATAQTDYQDPKGRFSVVVPKGWQLAPSFGDLHSIRFVANGDRRHGKASISVHVSEGARADWPRSLVVEEQPDVSVQSLAPVSVSGETAQRVRAMRREPKDNSRQHIVDGLSFNEGDRVFAVVFTRRRTDKPFYADVFTEVLASLRALSPKPEIAAPPPRATRPIGRWKNDDGLVLVLEESGRFTLADIAGRYQVTANRLTLELPGKGHEIFTFRMQSGALVLSSPNLPEDMVYRRTSSKGSTERGKTSVAPAALAGKWYGPKGKIVLTLGADGRFELGPYQGAWMIGGGKLRLAKSKSEIVEYSYQVVGTTLKLSGGDLDTPVVFRRTAL